MHHQNGVDALTMIFVVVVFAFMAALYFLPSIIAVIRHSSNTGSVIVLNLFLGWTLVGWVVSLALSVKSDTPPVVVVQQPIYHQPVYQPAPPLPGPPTRTS